MVETIEKAKLAPATSAHWSDPMPIATSAAVGGGSGCDVEAMEGFAVLRACLRAGVPAVELRAISNMADEPDRAKWDFAGGLAALADAGRRALDAL